MIKKIIVALATTKKVAEVIIVIVDCFNEITKMLESSN